MVVVGGQSNVDVTSEKQKNSSVKRTEKGGKEREKKERLKGEIDEGGFIFIIRIIIILYRK